MITTIKRIIYKLGVYLLGLFNHYPTLQTDKEKILSLIKKLYPIDSGIELIRFGPQSDGGYLLPDDLSGIKACFSPGVGNVSGFEHDCVKRGMKVFMADNTSDATSDEFQNFHFIKKHIGIINSEHFMTFESWVNTSLEDINTDLLLQMDIEGSEYQVIINMSEKLLSRFRIIIIEFHYLNNLWCEPIYQFMSSAFEKILETHFCVHIHPNNYVDVNYKNGIEIPYVMEFTFLRKDRIKSQKYANKFPHHLDYDNSQNQKVILPKCWYYSD